MTTGHQKLSDNALRGVMHCARRQLRVGLSVSRLAIAVSALCLPASGGSAQEKEPPRLFRGGLIQQLRSLTEDSSTARAEADAAKKDVEDRSSDDAPKIPTPPPVGDKPRPRTPTESRTANLRNSKSAPSPRSGVTHPNSAMDERAGERTNKLPVPGGAKSNQSARATAPGISNKAAAVGSNANRTAERGVPVTNPKLANDARFQLSDNAEPSSGDSADAKDDAANSSDTAATDDSVKVLNESPQVQAQETISQAPKVSRKPLPGNGRTSPKVSSKGADLPSEQATAPKFVASIPFPTQSAAPTIPAGLKPSGGSYALDQTGSPEHANSPLPASPEYPSLQVPAFAAPGATNSQNTKSVTSSLNSQSANKPPQFPTPPANLSNSAQTRAAEPKLATPHAAEAPANGAGMPSNSLELPAYAGLPNAPLPSGAGLPVPSLPAAGLPATGLSANGLPTLTLLPPASEPAPKLATKPNSAPTFDTLGTGLADSAHGTSGMAPRAKNPIRSNAATASDDEHMTMETPRLQVLLKGPHDMPVGTPADYQVVVRNVDDIPLDGVMLRLEIPSGVTINQGKPSHGELETERAPDGATLVTWSFTNLAAYQNASAPMQFTAKSPRNFAVAMEWTLQPKSGEAQFAVRQAQLELALEGPSEAAFGVANMYRLHVRNLGNAAAKNVQVKLGAASFGASETQIDEILAGEQQSIDVELTFNEKGTISINAEAVAAELRSAASIDVFVKQAFVTVAISGSDRVYRGSPSHYEVRVHNAGDLDSQTVRAELGIPAGTEAVAKPDGASIVNNKLTWEIPCVKAGQTLAFPIDLNLRTAGENKLVFACSTAHNQPSLASMLTIVEAIADLKLVVNDPIAPAPVGATVAYEMSITNRGSQAATNVRAIAQFSDGIEPVHAEGGQHRIVTGQVIFEPLVRIEAGETKILRVQAKAAAAGTHRFRAEVRSDETELRLVQEETTQYLDSASRIASPVGNSKVIR